jgi:hypothetical protein
MISLSTAEAEYIAITTVMREILYFQALIVELYEPVIPPIPIYCNNQGAVALASNNKFHACTKHINIHTISLCLIPGTEQDTKTTVLSHRG